VCEIQNGYLVHTIFQAVRCFRQMSAMCRLEIQKKRGPGVNNLLGREDVSDK